MTASVAMTDTTGHALGRVPSTSELAKWSVSECTELASRIREFLISHVSQHGGHLGANLATVELTISLHRTFRSPDTMIIWDTGHQAYTHKVLTGRVQGFLTLRERGGLAGFPSREESPHDLLENSHASVGPSWAYGVAAATARLTVVVLGDGALTGGVAYEALAAIGYRALPIIVVVNDNGRSYAPTPSRLTLGEPAFSTSGLGDSARSFFESLGFRVLGPVDGHDIAALDAVLGEARGGPYPCVVHARTQKGQGWPPAIADTAKRMHDVGPRSLSGSALESWSAAAGDLLCRLAEEDQRVHVITSAMPDTLGLTDFQWRFPHRYHDLGIAEQASVAVAAGLASQGARPFFAVITSFLTRAIDQVLNDVALHALPVVFLLDRAGVTGPDGPSHHGIYDVGLLRNVPGIEIYSPATGADLREIVTGALNREHGPLVIRYPKGSPMATVPLRPHSDAEICLVAHGPTIAIAEEAAEILCREGFACDVEVLTKIYPLDPAVVRRLRDCRLVVPVEDVSASGGLAPLLTGGAKDGGTACVCPVTLPTGFVPHGARSELLREFGLAAAEIAQAVRQAWEAAQ